MDILKAYGAAHESIARASERLALSPAGDVFTSYIRAAEREALAWLDGEQFIPDQLAADYGDSARAWRRWPFGFVRLFNRPLPTTGMPRATHISQWVDEANSDMPQGSSAPAVGIHSDRLNGWERKALAVTPLPRLIAGADLAAAFERIQPFTCANRVAGVIIAERYSLPGFRLSAGGIAAIGMMDQQTPWRALVHDKSEADYDDLSEAARDERCRIAWLEALRAGADRIVGHEKRLRLWLAHLNWHRLI